MSWEQRNHDFSTAQVDAQMAYIEAEREVKRLQDENEKLRKLVRKVEHYEQYGCHECPHGSSCDVGTLYDEDCAMSREIEREKRELGIEVDA